LRGLANLGVEHEPDLPASVDVVQQLSKEGSVEAVDLYSMSLLASLGPGGAKLDARDFWSLLHAGKDERQEVWEKLIDMRRD
jgi:hypothetical protein